MSLSKKSLRDMSKLYAGNKHTVTSLGTCDISFSLPSNSHRSFD